MIRNKIPSNASYLSNCDFINKYTLLQASKAPFLSKILLELASTDVYNALGKINQNDRNPETKIRLFLILYIFRIFQPQIRCSFTEKVKEVDNIFLLQISFSADRDIQSILTILFTEDWRPSFEKPAEYQKEFSNLKINAESLSDIKKFVEKNLSDFDSSKLYINCKFLFKNTNLITRKVSTKMIRNIAPFWISC